MSEDNRAGQQERLSAELAKLTVELGEFTNQLVAAEEATSAARTEETRLLNIVNSKQKRIGEIVKEMAKLAPHGTDWHSKLHSRPVPMSPAEESDVRRG